MRAVAFLSLLVLLAGCSGEAGRAPAKGSPAKTGGGGDPARNMSVREMVGQMFVVSLGGTEPDYYIRKMIRERNVGGVLLFGYNMRSLPQVRRLTGELQRLSMATEPAVPLLVAVDQEGGEVQSAPWVSPQPAAAEIGASGDPEAARRAAERIGSELREAGINTDLAPVVDTGFGAAIGSRSYGEDPRLVARMGAAAVEGFEAAGVISAAKHFPNHGPATSDSHSSLPIVDHDMDTVLSHDLPPFEAAVRAGVPMVMVGHLLYPAIDPENPASLSPQAIRLLRDRLGFDGVVITDDLAMAGARRGEGVDRAAVQAVSAGADMLIVSSPPPQQAEAYDAVVRAVQSGRISERQIRMSVRRILKMKEDYNLYARH
ncbi:Beta-hexosaminidase A [Rubrobacter xylanophilus DSM 9941]|uniref:glycoside hydrolase family 3 protein n=1 Tax=Rubrobacter xylanophilus TaxID=49319 RepID=UPI001C63E01B|nr:glycoside hydrolase family 3 protein [Rubrobacter xylanophilus]QYJ15132.1 Beta-hexosaminidase A [Rubrobacter xylanophilus DSM 9941]